MALEEQEFILAELPKRSSREIISLYIFSSFTSLSPPFFSKIDFSQVVPLCTDFQSVIAQLGGKMDWVGAQAKSSLLVQHMCICV